MFSMTTANGQPLFETSARHHNPSTAYIYTDHMVFVCSQCKFLWCVRNVYRLTTRNGTLVSLSVGARPRTDAVLPYAFQVYA